MSFGVSDDVRVLGLSGHGSRTAVQQDEVEEQHHCGIHSAWIENQLVCADSRSPIGAAMLRAQSFFLVQSRTWRGYLAQAPRSPLWLHHACCIHYLYLAQEFQSAQQPSARKWHSVSHRGVAVVTEESPAEITSAIKLQLGPCRSDTTLLARNASSDALRVYQRPLRGLASLRDKGTRLTKLNRP